MSETDFSDKAMGRSRFVFDKDMGCLIEITEGSNRGEPQKLLKPMGCIPDIEPYQPVAAYRETGIRPEVIGGRRQHRNFLRDNEYIEVGNSFVPNRREEMSQRDRMMDIKRALGE